MIETISFPQERDLYNEGLMARDSALKETRKLENKIKKAVHRLIEIENINGQHKDFWRAKWDVCQRIIRMSNEIIMVHEQ